MQRNPQPNNFRKSTLLRSSIWKAQTFLQRWIFFTYKYKTICVFFEFFSMSKFHQRILKIFSANAVSIEPSLLRQFWWDSDQFLRLPQFSSPKDYHQLQIDSSAEILSWKFLIAENWKFTAQHRRVCRIPVWYYIYTNSQTDRVYLKTDRVPTSTRPVFSVLHLTSLVPLHTP